MIEEIFITTQWGQVYGRSAGEPGSPAIIGLHGWSQRNGWHTWKPLLQPLGEAGYFVLSVDMPGWGQSDPMDSQISSDKQAVSAIMAIMDEIDLDSITLMGKSWGGGVALAMALEHASRVRNLILSAPAFRNIERLNSLSQPVLLAWSEDDPVIPFKYASQYSAIIPDNELVVYPTGGHSAAQKNSSDFVQKAIQFLDVHR